MNKLQQQHERTKALNREQERSFEEAIKNMKADNSLEEVDTPEDKCSKKTPKQKETYNYPGITKEIIQYYYDLVCCDIDLLNFLLKNTQCPSDIVDFVLLKELESRDLSNYDKLYENLLKNNKITCKILLEFLHKLDAEKKKDEFGFFASFDPYLNSKTYKSSRKIIRYILRDTNTTKQVLEELMKLITPSVDIRLESVKSFIKSVKSHPKYKNKG